jgi:hypothetical protein
MSQFIVYDVEDLLLNSIYTKFRHRNVSRSEWFRVIDRRRYAKKRLALQEHHLNALHEVRNVGKENASNISVAFF